MSNTKTVYLKLQCPKSRLDLHIRALVTAVTHGWQTIDGKIHSGATMVRTTLSRQVEMDSLIPNEVVWDCRPEKTPSFYPVLQGSVESGEGLDQLLAQILPENRHEEVEKLLNPTPIVPTKAESVFEQRPYTLEEVQKMKWQRLTQLGALLGIDGGNKQQREVKIVNASNEQWGTNG